MRVCRALLSLAAQWCRLPEPSVALVSVASHQPSIARLLGRCLKALGVRRQDLRLGLQLTAAYFIVLIFEEVDVIYDAFYQKPVWAMIVVIVLFDRGVGNLVYRSVLRLAGTIFGAAVGLGILYFAILCNGLTHDNHPQKFIITSACLALASGAYGVGAARFSAHSYFFITACIITAGSSLVGYSISGGSGLWKLALWRLLLTIIGIAVLILCSLILPVTSASILRVKMADTLGQLASVAEMTLNLGAQMPDLQPGKKIASQGGNCGARQLLHRLRVPLVPELLEEDEELFGHIYSRFVNIAFQASAALSSLVPLISSLRYEVYPTRYPHRLSVSKLFYSQRFARHLLNLLSSYTSFRDAHGHGPESALLGHKQQIESFALRAGQALRALEAMLDGDLSVDRALEVVTSLDADAERLFLRVVMSEERKELVAAGAYSLLGTETLAFLATSFTFFVWTARRLCASLVESFWGAKSREAAAATAALSGARWSTNERLILAAQGLIGTLEVEEECRPLSSRSSSVPSAAHDSQVIGAE